MLRHVDCAAPRSFVMEDMMEKPVTVCALCRPSIINEQLQDFELLRLAFFMLKLHKYEQRHVTLSGNEENGQDYAFRCNLLRHAIFQQVLRLNTLGAQEQVQRLLAAGRQQRSSTAG